MKSTRTIFSFLGLILMGLFFLITTDRFQSVSQAGVLRWTRNGPRKPDNPSQFFLINEHTVITSASGLSSMIGDSNAVYAGVDNDGVYKSLDHGNRWFKSSEGILESHFIVESLAMCWRDSSQLYAAGSGALYKSTDSAKTWKKIPTQTPSGISTLLVHPWDPRVLFAATRNLSGSAQSGFYHSVDSGKTWEPLATGLPHSLSTAAISASDSAVMYAAAQNDINNSEEFGLGIYRTTSFGLSWELKNNGLPDRALIKTMAVSPQDPNIVYVGISNLVPAQPKRIYKTEDGGKLWKDASNGVPVGASISQISISPLDPKVAFTVTGEKDVYKTKDGGVSWDKISEGLDDFGIRSVAVDFTGNFVYTGGHGVWTREEGSQDPIEPISFEPPVTDTCSPLPSIFFPNRIAPVGGTVLVADIRASLPDCIWPLSSTTTQWLRVVDRPDGGQNNLGNRGSGQVEITVSPNNQGNEQLFGRIGSVRILNRDFLIYQDGTRASLQQVQLKGTVTDKIGMPIPGVRMLLQGSRLGIATTDENGKYSFNVVAFKRYSYTVTPVKGTLTFTPNPNFKVDDPQRDVIADFRAPNHLVCVKSSVELPNQTNDQAVISFLDSPVTGIWQMNANGQNKIIKIPNQPGFVNSQPTWSRSGDLFAFVVNPVGTTNQGDIFLQLRQASRNLTNNPFDDKDPTFMSSGGVSKILFSSNRESGEYRLYKMNAIDGSNVERLTFGEDGTFDTSPNVSPDGTTIAFTRFKRNGLLSIPNIFLMDCNGSNLRQVTFTGGLGSHSPVWSPNGEKILYISDEESFGSRKLFVMNSNGSDQHMVDITFPQGSPGFGFVGEVAWAPRDDFFVFSDGQFIATAKLDGNKAVNVKVFAFPARSPNWQWSFPIARKKKPRPTYKFFRRPAYRINRH